MKSPLDIANEFFALTAPQGRDVATLLGPISGLLADDLTFIGPLMKTKGRDQYLALLGQFLPAHVGYALHKQFVNGDDVCSIYDMTVRTPGGEPLTLELVDWLTIKNGRIATQKLFYDPRKFAAAFGMTNA